MKNVEKGFTLLELMVVISIIGIMAALGMTSFYVYRSNAAYSNSEITLRNAMTALEAGLSEPDILPAAVPLTTQTTQGAPSTPVAQSLLPGMQLPKNLKFTVMYDPACSAAACETAILQTSHCSATEHTRYIRYGDGIDLKIDNISGGGCS